MFESTPQYLWVYLACILLIIELFTGYTVLLVLGVAVALAAAVAWFGGSIIWQLVTVVGACAFFIPVAIHFLGMRFKPNHKRD